MMKHIVGRLAADSFLVVLLLVLIASTLMCARAVPVEAQSNTFVDLFTQRGGVGINQSSDMFGPQETVRFFAEVVANGTPQAEVLVTFEITEPDFVLNGAAFYRTAETNESGFAETDFLLPSQGQNEVFGMWMAIATVEVHGGILQDFLPFKVGWTVEVLSVRTINENPPNSSGFPPDRRFFGETGLVGVEIALRNNLMSLRNVDIPISLVDELGQTVNHTMINDLILPPFGKIVYIYRTIGLPKYTVPGNATILVDALDSTKVSLCPQMSADFVITFDPPIFPTFTDDSVVYAEADPAVVEPGGSVNFVVIMRNEGTITLNDITVTMYVNTTLISTQTISSLDPYAVQFLNVTWSASGFPEGNYTFWANATVFPEEADLTDNVYMVPFEVGIPSVALHDVAVIAVQPQGQTVFIGEKLTVLVSVRNDGSMTETFNVTLYYDSHVVKKVTAYSVPPAYVQTLTFQWDTTNVPAGNYTMSAYAEPVAGETNLENNMFIDGVVRLLPPSKHFGHDVAIIQVSATPSVAFVGGDIGIAVEAANFGDYAETFNVTVYCNDSIVFVRQVGSLPPSQTAMIESTWHTSNVEAGTYVIRAEAQTVPGEVNTENNVLTDGQVTLLSKPPQIVTFFSILVITLFLVLVASLSLVVFVAAFFLRRRRKKRIRHSYAIIVHPHI